MLRKILNVISDLQPDKIVSIGDAIDFPQVSRWSKGTAEEYAPTLQAHISGFRNDVLVATRDAAPAADILWVEGNHDLRIKDYVRRYAAPLAALDGLKMESLFSLDELSIKYVRGPVRIATNTLAVHGHECGSYSSFPQAWDKKFMDRYGSQSNVVFGHTHQPFLTTRAFGHSAKVSPRWVMNVGSIMNPEDAHYVKDGSVSWVQSFGVIRDDGKRTFPELVTANQGHFYFEGKRY